MGPSTYYLICCIRRRGAVPGRVYCILQDAFLAEWGEGDPEEKLFPNPAFACNWLKGKLKEKLKEQEEEQEQELELLYSESAKIEEWCKNGSVSGK
eukprot:48458-Eustigmatos_ZCMA.PRE.1